MEYTFNTPHGTVKFRHTLYGWTGYMGRIKLARLLPWVIEPTQADADEMADRFARTEPALYAKVTK